MLVACYASRTWTMPLGAGLRRLRSSSFRPRSANSEKSETPFIEHRDAFTDLEVLPEQVKETLAEIHIEDEGISRMIGAAT